tara:strand:+ start:3181 stop:4980 length:1800 start_codon:yes stop_codon:yes gene_type:complete
MSKKIVPIDYTSRDFDSIRKSLIEHAKRYYPTTFKDFNKAGFGSLMIDTVSYVGDVLSFYLDYQANESFMETAAEYQNVIKLSRALGYNFNQSMSSYGLVDFIVKLPARKSDGSPDYRYFPTIKAGSQVSNDEGATFTLLDDIRFLRSSTVTVSNVDGSGLPTHYAVKAAGRVVSGITKTIVKPVGNFKKFFKVNVVDTNIAEILSVVDSEGNEYFEVDSLSQEVVYRPISNPSYDSTSKNDTANLIRKVAVPRRFTVQHNRNVSTIQFGHGSPLPDISGSVLDPSKVVMRRHAKTYYSDSTFDPVRLTNNDKMGIAPANTELTIRYRQNTQEFVNASVMSIKNKVSVNVEFESETNLDQKVVSQMISAMEVSNPEPITGDISLPTVDEIKMRAKGAFASQSRAVTNLDYVNMVYSMPSKFGAIKRCAIFKDSDSFKRNLNLHVISQNEQGHLSETNRTVKFNLRTYLNDARMINDTVDILDAIIYNFGVNYDIVIRRDASSHEAISNANRRLRSLFAVKMDIGEPLYMGNIYSELKKVPEILDVTNLTIVNKNGIGYSRNTFSVSNNTSSDGRVVNLPTRIGIFELKYPDRDIKGTVI